MLGLVIEQPDSASQLGRRLVERFRSAQFTRSTGHNALSRLMRQGLVRVVDNEESEGEKRYEATSLGLEHFRAWLRSSQTAAPPLREELQAKVAFCAPEDLPQLIEALRAEEHACASMFAATHGRLRAAALLAPKPATRAERWSELAQRAVLRDEAAMWGMRFKRLERLRARLEEMQADLPAPVHAMPVQPAAAQIPPAQDGIQEPSTPGGLQEPSTPGAIQGPPIRGDTSGRQIPVRAGRA
jgi:DNA-binding PadR family transcriptional regulator